MLKPSLLQTIIGTVAADTITLAVIFGAPLSAAQQTAILGFVGSISVAVLAIVSYLHGKHIKHVQGTPQP